MGNDQADTFRVQRSTTIAATPEQVFELLNDLRRWTEWSPWEGLDPDLRRTYDGPLTGVGSTYEWVGNRKVGAGRMQIVRADHPTELEARIEFIKPFKSTNTSTFHLRGGEDSTEIDWVMTGPRTIVTKVMGLFKSMDKMIGPDFEKGLAQLKRAVER